MASLTAQGGANSGGAHAGTTLILVRMLSPRLHLRGSLGGQPLDSSHLLRFIGDALYFGRTQTDDRSEQLGCLARLLPNNLREVREHLALIIEHHHVDPGVRSASLEVLEGAK